MLFLKQFLYPLSDVYIYIVYINIGKDEAILICLSTDYLSDIWQALLV